MKDSTKLRKPLKIKPVEDIVLIIISALAIYAVNDLVVTVNEWLTLAFSVVFIFSLLYIIKKK